MTDRDRKAYNSTLRPGKGFTRKKKEPKLRPTVEELKAKGLIKKASTIPKKKSARTIAIQHADTNFKRWVRLKAADAEGYLNCFICGKHLHWTESEAMHCEPCTDMSTRFDETNVQAGCHHCNAKPLGDRANFRAKLDEKFGPGTAEGNTHKSKRTEKHTNEYIRTIGDWYAERIEWIKQHEPSKFQER